MQLPNQFKATIPKKPLASLHDVIERGRVQCGIQGMSIAVLYKGDLIFAEGFGKRNEYDAFTAETLSPIGSLTKAFTATAIGELVAEGKMDWDNTPVSKYLPEFELKDPVLTSQLTLVDLLSHRTGLPDDVDLAFYKCTASRRDIIKRLRHVNMPSKLGSKTRYLNAMYAVAGEAAANIEGTSYEDVVREKVIKPLGLTNTGFSPVEMQKRSPNHAMPFSAASFEDAQKGVFKMEEHDEIYMAFAPSGDMYSNVLDVVRWGKAVMNTGELDGKQILNKESVQETLAGHTIDMEGRTRSRDFAPVTTYGLGWELDSYKGQTFYRHSGNVNGFSAHLIIFPDADLVIAQQFNLLHMDLAPNLSYHIADELLDLPKTQDWIFDVAVRETKAMYEGNAKSSKGNLPERIPGKLATHSLQAYVGQYTHPVLGDLLVWLENEKGEEKKLMFKIWGLSNELEHYHFDAFVIDLSHVAFKMKGLATFQTGQDGKIGTVLVDVVDGGEFKRKHTSE
ncbi:beta-lactamase/transpeptidase-like protein [Dissophora ornata]|nr:hypothetical protein BGZ58_003619 [Dissophora ornata]KAI8606306.1 beta-lactamase/transpeptidase-like protein [Dissophora ornata]